MAISRAPVFKRCRHLGIDPIVLGYTHRPSIRGKRPTRRKTSEYANQLKEKQKVKFVYGVLEKQFRLTYRKAEKMEGMTGENLLKLLELRFDNIVYRLGFATTRIQARQLVNHGHLRIDGKRVDIPSVGVKVGDEISVSPSLLPQIKARKFSTNRALPSWLSFDETTFTAKVIGEPKRSELDFDVTERSIVELYSK
jgi:small subunit ribosomal protein S4